MKDRKQHRTNLIHGNEDEDMEPFSLENDYEGGEFGEDGEFYFK